MADAIIQKIEQFKCPRGKLFAERRNRGYTLYDADSGAPVARLRPAGHEGRFEVLYWSLWKERWASAGPFGRTILSIDELRARRLGEECPVVHRDRRGQVDRDMVPGRSPSGAEGRARRYLGGGWLAAIDGARQPS